MRIISGKYRGRKLNPPKNGDVRPTSDMIKESVFNIIQQNIPGSRFLDLFAGSGAIGIEAISRGAAEVVFADSSRESVKLLLSNLDIIGENATVITNDYLSVLMKLRGRQFDIVYIDPPFIFNDLQTILNAISENDILADTGIVIYESLYNSGKIDDITDFELIKSKKYGTISIEIYSK